MSDSEKSKWYIINSRRLCEKKLYRGLISIKDDEKFAGLIQEVLLPSYSRPALAGARSKKPRDIVLMSGYVFLKMIATKECINAVSNLDGFASFLGGERSGTIRWVSEEEINEMVSAAKREEEEQSTTSFVLGQRVKILSGPFEGLSGTVDVFEPKQQRLKMSVPVLGKLLCVDLDIGQVSAE